MFYVLSVRYVLCAVCQVCYLYMSLAESHCCVAFDIHVNITFVPVVLMCVIKLRTAHMYWKCYERYNVLMHYFCAVDSVWCHAVLLYMY